MNNKDAIQYQGDKLVTLFAATGSAQAFSVLTLDHSLSLSAEGETLVARHLGTSSDPFVLERFSSARQASNALAKIHCVVRRRMRIERMTGIGRGIAKYVVLPLGLVLLGLSMNMAVHLPLLPTTSLAATNLPGTAMTQQSSSVFNPASMGLVPVVPANKISAALKRGAESGKYAIHFGATRGETVFVFEDPNCSHCRDFEPEIIKLSASHPIYIFPVSTIGGDESLRLNAIVLCSPESQRERKWALALASALTTTTKLEPGTVCVEAAKANDLMYTTIGLRVTPTVFNSKGEMMPLHMDQTAPGIEAWLKSGN